LPRISYTVKFPKIAVFVRWLGCCVVGSAPDLQTPACATRCEFPLVISLRPQLAVVASAVLFVVLLVCAGLVALLHRESMQGVIWLMLAASGAWSLAPDLWLSTGHRPRNLILQSDGGICLSHDDGSLEPVALQASSLDLGYMLFLVVKGRSRYRLLLSVANVAPGQLAALRRSVAGH
jgi:hypothetical protein